MTVKDSERKKRIPMTPTPTGSSSLSLKFLYNKVFYGNDAVINTLSRTATYYFDGGYVDIKITGSGTWPVTQFYYYAKDHLGNIRSVVTKNSQGVISEVQKTHYYPFGGIIADISKNHLSGLRRLLSERAQRYDCTAPHFTTTDPLADKYYGWDMYGYCMNNPVNMFVTLIKNLFL